MIERIIDWCAANRFLVVTGTIVLAFWGVWSMRATPLDAVPDISDVQVIVATEWEGRSPDLIEDQITYPIVTSLISTPRVRTVRGFTDFGISWVFVIFEDGTDIYWARSRVLEYLQGIRGLLPDGVSPTMGPDATGVGWVFQYALVDETGQHSLADLRSVQDFSLRYWLASVPGVAEVASIGGFVKQYQVNVDPNRLAAYNLSVPDVVRAIRASNNEVEGRLLEFAGREYMVRARGYLRSLQDIERVSLGVDPRGTPIRVRDVAQVRLGPDIRRGVAELDGRGEVVGGIVIMRFGENALTVIDRVKAKLQEVQSALPAGVTVVPVYDRSWLINESIGTLRKTLIAEAIVVSVVIMLFLLHFRSALIPIVTLPIAVIASFIPMYYMGVTSNIMSLGGIALAIGVLVDSAIVMVENAYRHLTERIERPTPAGANPGADTTDEGTEPHHGEVVTAAGDPEQERRVSRSRRFEPVVPYAEQPREVIRAAKQVGRPIFFSLLIIIISFVPVFLLEAQEGRMFRPLAYTKTFAMVFATLLSITLVPVMMTTFIRGRRLRPESANPVSRAFTGIYSPVLRLALRWRWALLGVNLLVLGLTLYPLTRIGNEFMPPLYEGSILYMPTALPGLSVGESTRLLQVQDKVLREFPEVERVFGSVGRATTPTDNSPMGMVNTVVTLKPRDQWRPGMTFEHLVAEMDEAVQLPGFPNVWTQPIRNRLDMLLTGIRTPVGIKILGPDLQVIEELGQQVERVVQQLPEARSVFAERVTQGYFTNIEVNRDAIARYGLTIDDVHEVVQSAIGGQNVTRTIEGRERYPVNVRYGRDLREDLPAIGRVLIRTPTGAQIPLGQMATVTLEPGPAMIRNEDGLLAGYVYVDTDARDIGGFVQRAQDAVRAAVALPPAYTLQWTGQYEFQIRARERLQVILPIVFFVILVLLHMAFRSFAEAGIVMVSVLYAMTGGILLQWWLDYNFSVAVWVGYIALYGMAVQTGVIMIIYLNEAMERRLRQRLRPARGAEAPSASEREGGPASTEESGELTERDILDATIEGSVLRLRPKLMTVGVTLAALIPIMWSTGVGSDLMRPIAAPIVGGVFTSTVHVLINLPVMFYLLKRRALRKGTLRASEVTI